MMPEKYFDHVPLSPSEREQVETAVQEARAALYIDSLSRHRTLPMNSEVQERCDAARETAIAGVLALRS